MTVPHTSADSWSNDWSVTGYAGGSDAVTAPPEVVTFVREQSTAGRRL